MAQLLRNLRNLKSFHSKIQSRRDAVAPLAYHTYDQAGKHRTTWHPKVHAWVDPELPLTRQEYNEYCWGLKDLQRMLPFAAPLAFGPLGFLPIAYQFYKKPLLPSALASSKKDIAEVKLEYYEQWGDEIKQKSGPLLQMRMQRLFRGQFNREHVWLYSDLVESFKSTFYSHHTREIRDVRKCAHLKYFDGKPTTLLLTNKDPLDLTPELEAKLNGAKSEEEKRQALIEAYKNQELHGGPSINHMPGLELPFDSPLVGENAKEGKSTEPLEDYAPVEELQLTGDTVFIPNEYRLKMESWDRETQKLANEFLGLSFRFAPASWNQHRLVIWYEQILQEDALIKREGGISRLTDIQLKVALLDRCVMRVDENLTRGDMEARYKEISWLMEQRLNPAIILSWQTGYWRTTYSPEDDLPEATILPKFNRTRLDVDTHNYLAPDERGAPTPVLHPALYPGAHKNLAAELKSM